MMPMTKKERKIEWDEAEQEAKEADAEKYCVLCGRMAHTHEKKAVDGNLILHEMY